MTQLNKCLTDKLDNFSDFGDSRFGTSLNSCFNEILALVGGGGDSSIPTYANQTDFLASNIKADGAWFLNTTTGTIEYCYSGNWIEIDIATLQACCNTNSAAIAAIQTNITNINTSITNIQGDIGAHNHDGIDTPKIDVKNLDTSTAAAGDIFSADGAGGVICSQPAGASLTVEQSGVTTITDVEQITIDCDYLNAADAGGGEVVITCNDLVSDIDSLFAHDHSNGTVARVPADGIDSTGLATANSHYLCNDGLGKAVWTPKSTGATDFFVEKYRRTTNVSIPFNGNTVVPFDIAQDFGNTAGVCTQLQAGNTGCIEILADGIYSLDMMVATTPLPVSATSRLLLNVSVTGSFAEFANLDAIQPAATNGGYRAYLSGNYTRYYQTGDIICIEFQTFGLNGGGFIDSNPTYAAISKVQ